VEIEVHEEVEAVELVEEVLVEVERSFSDFVGLTNCF
jgi:hypothetical protein